MTEQPPYPWLGSPTPPEFIYGDCGHLLGCTDPMVDLLAKQREVREQDFMRCLSLALRTGNHGRRSSCQQSGAVCEAVDAIAADPSDENRERAVLARWDHEEWLAEDDE